MGIAIMKISKASSQPVKPYGSLEADAKEEASLPVSTDLLRAEIVVAGDREGDDLVQLNISNATTAVDRKLWALLLFLVWEDLEKKVGINEWHEMPMDEVQRYFERLSGSKDVERLWESAQRLARTTATCRHKVKDERVITVSSIFYAQITEEFRSKGWFRFNFPPPLIPILKEPMPFARLRMHFMLGLRSKYSVNLYQLFESIINQHVPSVELSVKELRTVMGVPPRKLTQWVHLWQKAVEPALEELNANPAGSGMHIEHELVRAGRGGKVQAIKFRVQKANERIVREGALRQQLPSRKRARVKANDLTLVPIGIPMFGERVYANAKKAAPRYDVYALEREWREWIVNREDQAPITNLPGHFIGFCKSKATKHPLF